ncbi:MAG: bifunctional [glutamate--ammonia ligase]-adenylyl-L-tyrosine phosphorylase/[glutamate--ammonia-ligase] adenylyltransferase [Nitrospirota bacterium]|nr:bifunctional [glutamate--ammonia ligase]-adenylyl-L-tyrosine phosphorylase/[glutamate--ammonia-ligase] adenylyltransferase [Nitrospirota bacterium]
MRNDNEIPIDLSDLESTGIADAKQANVNLGQIRQRIGDGSFAEMLQPIIAGLRHSGDPDMALNHLERFLAELDPPSLLLDAVTKRPPFLTMLLTLFGASRFLSSYAISIADATLVRLSDPAYLAAPAEHELLEKRLSGLLAGLSREGDILQAMRRFRKDEMLRIGLRDLLGMADLSETVSELSALAEVTLQAAYAWADENLTKRYGTPGTEDADGRRSSVGFAIIGMGKLGGGELNFSSDVDLMYVYGAEGETEGVVNEDGARTNRITNHQYFIKLGEMVSSAIGRNTEEGFVFRVDLRLRPEGQRGPLAQSLSGYEIYYESWGQTWERSALIKARRVAGDEVVGQEFEGRILPFIYRKYLDFSSIAEIRDMKQKINREVQLKGKTHRDVKLGYGGIREIEFLVQALQLIYGGRDRTLRERGTMKALHILSQKGLLTYEETRDLLKAYVFLRTVEHRLQMLNDLQTQTLPTADAELRTLARRTGYLRTGSETTDLLRDYHEHARKVRNIYDQLLDQPNAPGEAPEKQDFSILLEPDTTEQEAIEVLGRYGFRDTRKAHRNITLLREGQAFTHQTPRSRRAFVELFPQLFREVVGSPDPDMALNHLEAYLGAQGSWDSFQSVMRQDPRTLPVLVSVFGSSEYFSRMLVRTPALVEDHADATAAGGSIGAMACRRNLQEAIDKAVTITDKLDALRYFKKREELHIGMADLSGSLPPRQVWKALSRLAEACLSAALRLAVVETQKRYGGSSENGEFPGLAVAAAGKLGGREIIYGSDLDILFVYDETRALPPPPGLTVFEHMSRVAEKVISYLTSMTREGAAYRVDTRLRPTGQKGPLVQSIEAFRTYFTGQAETWERQALISLRATAGDTVVGSRLEDILRDLIYRNSEPAALAADVRNMRKRMQTELAKEDANQYDIKQGVGGLVDIDFTAQYLLLLHGREHARLKAPGTINALKGLQKERLLSTEDARTLINAYVFLRMLESRMRIVANQSTSLLTRDPGKAGPLARRLGYKDREGDSAGKQLLEEYASTSRKVREIFERVVKS